MTRYLSTTDVIAVAEDLLGAGAERIRDVGLLQSAVARPQTTVFATDAYPSVMGKAAALLHSLAANHALVDGNKRTALVCTLLFLEINEVHSGHLDEDSGESLVLAVARGQLTDADEIAVRLHQLVHADPAGGGQR